MIFPFLTTTSLVGLDIQPGALHLVKLKKTKRRFLVECVMSMALPPHTVVENKIKNEEVLAAALTEVVQLHHLEGEVTALQIPANLVRMQSLQLPAGTLESEIEAEIAAQVRRDLPGMEEALDLDFSYLSRGKKEHVALFYAATRQAYLSRYIACVQASGLKVKIVDVDVYALQRAVFFNLQQANQAILHFTGNGVMLLGFDESAMVLQHYWDLTAANDIAAFLQKNIELSFAMHNMTLDKIAVSGSHECLAGLADEFNYELFYPNPFAFMETPTRDSSLAVGENLNFSLAWREIPNPYLIACGLAMREVPKW